MKATNSFRLLSQPLVACVTGGFALLLLGATWSVTAPDALSGADLATMITALALVGCVVLAYQFPIHVDYRQKLELTSLPLFMLTVLLPLPLAISSAGLAYLAAELSVRKKRGNYPSDVATQTARMMIVAGAGNLAYSAAGTNLQWPVAALCAGALSMWALDVLTQPLLIAPVTGETAWQVLRGSWPQAVVPEGLQYVVGIVGAVALADEPITLLGLLVAGAVAYRLFKNALELQRGTMAMLENLADTVDLRDPYTGGHSRRVTEFCAGILNQMNYGGPDADLILTAARVHDIGKIGVPDVVLNKPGPLTPEERRIMESHPVRGAELLRRYGDFVRGVAIVRHHHERWDGKGYPDGLVGTAIPLGARVIAVADSFDAMTSDRPYRRGMADSRAVEILRNGRGEQWDAELVDAFLDSIAPRLAEQLPQPVLMDAGPQPLQVAAVTAAS